MKLDKVIIGITAFVILLSAGYLVFTALPKQRAETPSITTTTQSVPTSASADTTFAYQGEEGKDALTLLQEKAVIQQDASGLVVSINGRKTDTTKREYWAFYVNGKLSEVGPAQYEMDGQDEIEWKIETY